MTYYEYIGNMHMHTPYSDGEDTHREIADAAIKTKLDFVIVTDHNIWVDHVQGYYGDDQRGYVLLLTGEEIHDRNQLPQVNHCLVYGTQHEMSEYAHHPQTLINAVKERGGLSFLAHPFDTQIPWQQDSSAIAWVDWDVTGYTGLEIWNYMSSFKTYLLTPAQTLRYVYQPHKAMLGPSAETLAKWDALLATGQKVVGIGNSDAHGTRFKVGPLQRVIFPYEYLFQCVNTHILPLAPFSGVVADDEALIYQTLRAGRAFISYQLVGNAKGFRFTGQGATGSAMMGENIRIGASGGVTLQVVAPTRATIKLIRHGEIVATETNKENLTYVALQPGAYRVEVWKLWQGVERCWILSNPIYVDGR